MPAEPAELIRNLVLTLVPMILSLTVHEYAHAWVATRLGDDTPEQEERLTLSPLAHIDPIGTLLFPALSVLTGGMAFLGWAKPVNINPNRFRRDVDARRGMAIASAAGPLSNLLLAVLSMGLLVALTRAGVIGGSTRAIAELLKAMFTINVGLCVFNFLPLPPLDGSRLLPRSLDDLAEKIRPYSFLILMGILMVPALRVPLIDLPMGLLYRGIMALFGVGLAVARPPVAAVAQPAAAAPPAPLDPLAYNVALPQVEFEGPLDLLLHLIQSHQLNILDIPIRFITERYLAYLSVMQQLSIDVASEYLVMAAVLAHIKSKMLLPVVPTDQKDELEDQLLDPRQELVQRLLEYQRFKAAAAEMGSMSESAQDAFARPPPPPPPRNAGPLAAMPLHLLVDAFTSLLDKRKVKIGHEVTFDRLTITDRMNQLTDVLRVRRRATFDELFEGTITKFDLVITFLALLEMSKLKLTRLYQAGAYALIHIEYTVQEVSDEEAEADVAGEAPDEEPASG